MKQIELTQINIDARKLALSQEHAQNAFHYKNQYFCAESARYAIKFMIHFSQLGRNEPKLVYFDRYAATC